MTKSQSPKSRTSAPQWRRLVLDLGPLLLFFVAFRLGGIFAATATFMVAVTAALAVDYTLTRKVSPMSLATAALVLVFGGLTIWLRDDTFLKIKVTIIYTIFAVALLGGLRFNRLYIKYVFAIAFEMTEAGWRTLTLRAGIFFVCVAMLNEIVWRAFSTETWVDFKVFGVTPLTFLFMMSQVPLFLSEEKKMSRDAAPPGPDNRT